SQTVSQSVSQLTPPAGGSVGRSAGQLFSADGLATGDTGLCLVSGYAVGTYASVELGVPSGQLGSVTVVYPLVPAGYTGILVYGSAESVPLYVPDEEWAASGFSSLASAVPAPVRVDRGIVCDSGATCVMCGDLSACTDVDYTRTVAFTMVTAGSHRTDATVTFHLYGVCVQDGAIDHFVLPNSHYKAGCRTLLSSRVMLSLGFGSPDLVSLAYTHLPTGRVYRIIDSGTDYMWAEVPEGAASALTQTVSRVRTGEICDWMWARSEYAKWAFLKGSPAALAKTGEHNFDISPFGDDLPPGVGNNQTCPVRYSLSDSCWGHLWAGAYIYGNPPFDRLTCERMLKKANRDFATDPEHTVFLFLIPQSHLSTFRQHLIHWEVLHVYPAGTEGIFSYRREHTYAGRPLQSAGSEGGGDRVFIVGTPFPVAIIYRDQYTSMRFTPERWCHSAYAHAHGLRLAQLMDLGVDIARPGTTVTREQLLSHRTCAEACAVRARMRTVQPSPKHPSADRYRAQKPGSMWAADATGPITPIGYDGSRYRWTFVEFTVRFTLCYFSAEKSAYSFILAQFLADVVHHGFACTGLVLRTDCAPELCDPAAQALYKHHGIKHLQSSPTLHWQNFMAEYVIGKVSSVSRALLETAGMDLTYWPLADSHACLLWDILPHGRDAVVPFYHLMGYHFTYSRIEIFGTLCTVAMDAQQMRARHPGVSKTRTPRAWQGRFVGISLRSSAYKVLDLERNKVVSEGRPDFIRNYSEFGQVISSFPAPAPDEQHSAPVPSDRPEPWRDYTTDMVVTIHSVAAYYDTRDGETYATVQLLDTGSADTFWTTAQQYVMADPAGTAWFDLVHWLDRRRVIDCVNQHYPLWTLAKAQEARGDPLYPALIVSTDMRRSRSYGVLFRPMAYGDVTAPRAYAMDLRASLVVFPDTHSACHLPFSDHPEQDQWLLPHYVVPPEDTVGTLPASGTLSFSHISADLAERLYHTAAPDLPLPGGYRQALSMPDGAQWEEAITGGEVQPLIDQGKIEPVEVLPDGEIATSTIFVLNKPWKPRDGLPPVQIHKARMAVAATWHWGYTQAETACTVADLPTFRLLFILSIIFAEAGQQIHEVLHLSGNALHPVHNSYDPCLYYIVTSVFVAFVAVYVDDFGLTCDDAFHQAFWAAFQAAFKSKNLGRMTAVLQLAVDYDRWGIALSQTRQIKELMSKFKLPAKTYHNPMDVNLVIQKPEHPDLTLVTPYLSLLGSLLWIARCTRPDIYYSVIYLAQFSSCPSAQAWEALQRVAQYLYFTRHYRIRYAYPSAPLSVLTIQVYSDADHARDKLNGCLSYSGGIVFLNGMVLHWVCARQTDAEMSSTGSEYVAASVVGQRAMSAIHMIVEMFGFIRITQQEPGVSALALSTAFPAADTSWMQRAAAFFENHAMGHGQMGPASPLHYREAEPVPDSSLYALPHAVPVPYDGTGYEDGPREYHSQRSGMYGTSGPFIPRLELPVAVMIDNQAASSILRNVMLSTKIKHVLIRFHCFRGWVCAGYLVPVYINTLLNLADIFTKPLPGLKDKVRVIISMIESFMDVIRPHPSGAGDS
ncbi:hypothetical protein CYMTET_40540, partial [Cymbomonas tetramitiformis]